MDPWAEERFPEVRRVNWRRDRSPVDGMMNVPFRSFYATQDGRQLRIKMVDGDVHRTSVGPGRLWEQGTYSSLAQPFGRKGCLERR